MYINRIEITGFRNFHNYSMDFNDGLNVIVGANNSGKTGLLLAINLLSNPGNIEARITGWKEGPTHRFKKEGYGTQRSWIRDDVNGKEDIEFQQLTETEQMTLPFH